MEIELQQNKKIENEKTIKIFKFLFTCLGTMLPLICMSTKAHAHVTLYTKVNFSLPVTLLLAVFFVLLNSYFLFSGGANRQRAAMGFIMLYALYVILMWEEIGRALRWWIYTFQDNFSVFHHINGSGINQNYLICAALGVYSLVMVVLSWRKVYRIPLFFMAVFWIVLGGIRFDLMFHWRIVFFILYLFCLLGMGNKRPARRNGKAYFNSIRAMRTKAAWQNGIWLVVFCLLLMGIYAVVLPPVKYHDSDAFVKKQNEVIDFVENHTLEEAWNILKKEVFPSDMASGGMAGGKLGRVKGIQYENIPQLEIIIPLAARAEGMYLKGFVGGEYTGTEWIGQEDEEEFAVEKRSYHILSGMEEITTRAISIHVLDAQDSYSYRPYFSTLSKSLKRIRDNENYLYQDRESKENVDAVYSFCKYNQAGIFAMENYHYATSSDEFADAIVKEKRYREKVFNEYLDISGVKRLDKEMSTENVQDENGELLIRDGKMVESYYRSHGLSPYVRYVQKFLQDHAKYSLTPGKLEEGEDFVEDFLYNKKKGYCTAFASAGTLVFRRLGIPARYVEGYILGKNDIVDGENNDYINDKYVRAGEATYGVRFTLTDRNAHAWVEIYEEGAGWIPAEVTPGYQGEVNTLGRKEEPETIAPSSEAMTSTKRQEEEKSTKETKKKEPNSSSAVESELTTVWEEQPQKTTKNNKILFVILFFVIVMFLLVSSLLTYKKKHKSFYKKKKKEKRSRRTEEDKERYIVRSMPRDSCQKAFLKWERAWHRVLRFQGLRKMKLCSTSALADIVMQIYTYLDKEYVYENLKLMEKCHYSREGVGQEEYRQIYEFLYGMVFASYTHARFWEKPFLKILASRYFHFEKIGV